MRQICLYVFGEYAGAWIQAGALVFQSGGISFETGRDVSRICIAGNGDRQDTESAGGMPPLSGRNAAAKRGGRIPMHGEAGKLCRARNKSDGGIRFREGGTDAEAKGDHMTEKELLYVTEVLKGKEPQELPDDWYVLIGFLQSHRVGGLFYSRAKAAGISLPKKAEKVLRETYEKQKRRVQFLRGYISELSEGLRKAQAEYVFLKGSVLANLSEKEIYADGERASEDIDLLVKPDGTERVENVLRELGYIQGEYDAAENTVKRYSRIEIVKRRLNRGETAPYIKLTGNREIPFVEADINFSLGNTPQDGQALLAETVCSGREYAGKVSLRVPDAELFFLHLIMHQYKESCLYFMAERGKDLELYKLADIFYLIKAEAYGMEKTDKVVGRHKTGDRLGAVLQQVGEVFDDEEILRMAERYGRAQPDVLDYEGKKRYTWTAPVRERIRRFDALRYLRGKGEI